jgi:hypothetical protein
MTNALNTKLLIAIYALLASIASSQAWQNHRQAALDAQKAAMDKAWTQAEQNAKQPEIGVGEAIQKRWK